MAYISQLLEGKVLYLHRLKFLKKEKMTSEAENLENASQGNLGKLGIIILVLLRVGERKVKAIHQFIQVGFSALL